LYHLSESRRRDFFSQEERNICAKATMQRDVARYDSNN
jgi:hypothetical protein